MAKAETCVMARAEFWAFVRAALPCAETRAGVRSDLLLLEALPLMGSAIRSGITSGFLLVGPGDAARFPTHRLNIVKKRRKLINAKRDIRNFGSCFMFLRLSSDLTYKSATRRWFLACDASLVIQHTGARKEKERNRVF